MPSDVVVTSHGFVAATVCVPEEMPTEKVVEEANRLLGPTGLNHGWMLSDDAEFARPVLPNGKKLPNPCPCERTPGRVHRLLNC